MLISCNLFLYVAVYKRCDGIILPEHTQPPSGENSGILGAITNYFRPGDEPSADTCNGVKLSSFNCDTKTLQHKNHVELRKNALFMHLENVYETLCGKKAMENPVGCVESVYAIYSSLNQNFLCYKSSNGYSDHPWNFSDTEKVQRLYYMY